MFRLQPVRITIRNSLALLLMVILNTVHVTNMANNEMDKSSKENNVKLQKSTNTTLPNIIIDQIETYARDCPSNMACSNLTYPCIKCDRQIDCIYGQPTNYSCAVLPKVTCMGAREFKRVALCRFCYQTEHWENRCIQKANCNSVGSPRQYYRTNCTVLNDVICLGRRQFAKRIPCSWTGGTRWSTALIIALTLGGFGADRFYLGHWQEGIGKLFSFGGLGVWTLIDALLIGVHHLGPADGSLYI